MENDIDKKSVIYCKERKSTRELIDLAATVQNSNSDIVFSDYRLWISENNDSSVIWNEKQKLEIFCHKVSALSMKRV